MVRLTHFHRALFKSYSSTVGVLVGAWKWPSLSPDSVRRDAPIAAH
jgi:hypothetical protein